MRSRWSCSVTSTGSRAHRCLRGGGQVKKVCYETSCEGGNPGGWTDRQWKVVSKRRGARAELWSYGGEARSKRCVLQVVTERADRQQQVVPKRLSTRLYSSCTFVGLDPRDLYIITIVWSQWVMGVMQQAWGEDKQAVFHTGHCRSANWSWTIVCIFLATNAGREKVEHCK